MRLFALLALMVVASPLLAQSNMPSAPYADRQLENPAEEAEARALMETLRCLQCQGQSIADSDAPIAGDLRHQVRSRIEGGESPDAIRAYLVDRYGRWISYDPPVDALTWPLWLAPLLFVAIGLWFARGRFARDPGEGEGDGE